MTSIQGRLGIWLVGSVLILFGLNWLLTSGAGRVFTEHYVAGRLEDDGESLLAGLKFDPGGRPLIDARYTAPIYQRPYSGHYFIIVSGDHRVRSRSLWDQDLPLILDGGSEARLEYTRGPLDQALLVWTDHFKKNGRHVSIAVAEDLSTLNARIATFRGRFAVVTLLLLATLIVTQRLIVRMSLKPLDRIKEDCRRLEKGEITHLCEAVPAEARPMVREINHLVTVMQQRQARRRNALGNLAHAIKAPLTRLTQLIEQESARLDHETVTDLRDAATHIGEMIDRELKRARLSGPTLPGQRCNLSQELPDLIDVIKKLYAHKDLMCELAVPSHKTFGGDREDLVELFGNLLDNAAKWAKSMVRLVVADSPGLTFSVEDDGLGLDDDRIRQLTERGTRFDESKPGHGLGLAIVKDIVDQHEGRLYIARSTGLGGLRVTVHLPEPASELANR
jgi:signal transduction histidine kinase